MMVEYSRLANAPMTLDRAQIERYQLLIIRLSSMSFAEMTTCVFLIRILNLEIRPAIVLIAENEEQIRTVRSTRLKETTCVLANQLSSTGIQELLDGVAKNELASSEFSLGEAPPIPGYRIREPIAGTYSATVYRAFSEKQGKDVALKISELNTQNKCSNSQVSLKEEFSILRKLGGEHVAVAYEYGEVANIGFIAMEYFRRGSIDQLFAGESRGFSRVEVMLRVANALAHVHQAGFLHLDLKPNNLLVRDDGSPALIDFGISKRIVVARYQEHLSYSMGSPFFMSPEQIRGEPLDIRSDIYSFGAVWYRIFTGQTPFPGRSIEQIRKKSETGIIPDMGVALRRYQSIVDRTLAYNREDRFESTEQLIDAIHSCAAETTGIYRQIDPLPDLESSHCG
jgi:serine/threonine protein kinase